MSLALINYILRVSQRTQQKSPLMADLKKLNPAGLSLVREQCSQKTTHSTPCLHQFNSRDSQVQQLQMCICTGITCCTEAEWFVHLLVASGGTVMWAFAHTDVYLIGRVSKKVMFIPHS